MIKLSRTLWRAAILAMVCFAPFAFGQSVNLTLDNGGSYTMDGIYVGPYNATQNYTQSVQVICDDFSHNVYAGESWTANVTNATALSTSLGSLLWGSSTAGGSMLGGTYSALQGYESMLYLAAEMLPLSSNPKNSTEVAYLSYAIWAIFDSTAVYNWLSQHNDLSAWAQVQSLAENALKGSYTTAEFAGWEILTPICTSGCPQEYFEYVPEGGSALMYLLLAGVSCFGAMFFRKRRQSATS
jgi:hypothetical protein